MVDHTYIDGLPQYRYNRSSSGFVHSTFFSLMLVFLFHGRVFLEASQAYTGLALHPVWKTSTEVGILWHVVVAAFTAATLVNSLRCDHSNRVTQTFQVAERSASCSIWKILARI
ncbi:hypothetical protein QBC32DRAFT_25131 [Pseudoneurospora amorphoporcata]|uniref:Uncharacterized protein n=1 Tax=Pseudoneurospora amorphoporcata TaxID=241081 RepID=A0AAN6NRZ3_9PEZI|nr:hypothetical protein QBC32DRAFT_25131 [Pseudoneurospora amorphoporcata]